MTEQLHILNEGDVLHEANSRVRRTYGSAIGRHYQDVVTPALILDLPAARGNIRKMATRMRSMTAALRPHIKVHKSPQLARMQMEAGAVGVSTATIWEAIVMVRAGIQSVFIVNTLAGAEKLAALAALAREAEVMVAIDDAANASAIAAAARDAGTTIGVLIEVDTGMDRAGVDTESEALALAKHVSHLDGIRFLGVTGYEGHCSLTPDSALRHERQRAAMASLVETAHSIAAAGLQCLVISAGGTATWLWTAGYPGVTESQAGSYVVMDNFHGAMVDDFELALTVLTTVISRPQDRVILDAGNKSVGAPGLASLKGFDLSNFRFDEEHGIFAADAETSLVVGDVVELVPGYSPGTVNLFDAYHVVEDDHVVDIWPVLPRGPGHGGLIN